MFATITSALTAANEKWEARYGKDTARYDKDTARYPLNWFYILLLYVDFSHSSGDVIIASENALKERFLKCKYMYKQWLVLFSKNAVLWLQWCVQTNFR